MRTPLITSADAERLNLAVREKIDPSLFLCCNYTPTKTYVYSEDGFFLTSVQDLYKFAFDTSCIISKWKDFVPNYKFNELGGLLYEIKMLRSFLDHNQSEADGTDEKKCIEWYKGWVNKYVGGEPSSPEDFAKLNKRLEVIAKKLLSLLESFVNDVAQAANSQIQAEVWKEKIFQWYSNNTKTSIYWSFLKSEYLSKSKKEIADKDISWKVNAWITKAVEPFYNNNSKQTPKQFFFSMLPTQLRISYDYLKSKGTLTTLLPQDFLAEDIKLSFGGVPSPERDF